MSARARETGGLNNNVIVLTVCGLLVSATFTGCAGEAQLRQAREQRGPLKEMGLTRWDMQPATIEVDANEPWLHMFFDPDVYSVPSLIETLRDTTLPSRQRAQAAMILGRYRCSDALQPLLTALEDPDHDVALGAVRGLGDLRDSRAVPALMSKLVQALSDPAMGTAPSGVVCGYQRSFGASEIGIYLAADPLDFYLDATEAMAAQPMSFQDHVATALGKIGDRAAVPLLVKMLASQDGMVHPHPFLASERRAFVADALGKIGDPSALPALRLAAEANDTSEFGGEWGDWPSRAIIQIEAGQKTLPELEADLKSRDKYVRYYAAKALASMDGPQAAEALKRLTGDATVIRRDAAVPTVEETIAEVAATAAGKAEAEDGR